MAEKISIELGSVQKTLLMPLWGRAIESKRENPLLTDDKAVEIFESLDYDFTTISDNIYELTRLAWIARSINIDSLISHYLFIHPKATIVDLGCGLDTSFERTDNGLLNWYDIDLPDVIMLRRKFIKESDRRKSIASDCLYESWFQQIKFDGNVLFLAAGVFYYFEENQVRDFFLKLANKFPGSEMIFDVMSPRGIKLGNERVLKTSGLDKGAELKWGIDNSKSIEKWSSRIKIINEFPLYKEIRSKLKFKDKFSTLVSEFLKIMYMVHLKFEYQ